MADYPDWTSAIELLGSEIQVPIDVQGAYIQMPIDIQGQYITLDINIAASAITLNVAIASSAVTLNVNISSTTAALSVNLTASAITLNISITAQTVAIRSQGEFSAQAGADLTYQCSGSNKTYGQGATVTHTVPAGKTLYITSASMGIWAYLAAGADLPQEQEAEWSARFSEEVMRSGVRVEATIPLSRMTLGELSGLFVGQVLEMP